METIQDLIISKRKMAIFSLSLLVIKTPKTNKWNSNGFKVLKLLIITF
jgi:hypothetical protein